MIKKITKYLVFFSIIFINYCCQNINGLYVKQKKQGKVQKKLLSINNKIDFKNVPEGNIKQEKNSNNDQVIKTRIPFLKRFPYKSYAIAGVIVIIGSVYGNLASFENFSKSCVNYSPFYSNCNATNKFDFCCKNDFPSLDLCLKKDYNISCTENYYNSSIFCMNSEIAPIQSLNNCFTSLDNCVNTLNICEKQKVNCFKTNNYYLTQNESNCNYYNGGLKYCQNRLKDYGIDTKYCLENENNSKKYLTIGIICLICALLIFIISTIYYRKSLLNRYGVK